MIWLTADQHFCHSNILKLSGRPWGSIVEMNEALIGLWNGCVSEDDEVYILGDFMYKGTEKQANEILFRLNGRKYLIRGNHEKYLEFPDFNVGAFEWVKDYHVLSYKDARFVFFHYPILEWAHYFRKSIHCYGHVHGNAIRGEVGAVDALGNRAFDVGVDTNNYCPVSIDFLYNKVYGE